MNHRTVARLALSLALVSGMLAPSALAKPGDLYVGDPGAHKVFRVSTKTGHLSVVAHGHHLDAPDSGAFDHRGHLLIADYDAFNTGAIFRIDTKTGHVKTLSKAAKLTGPTDVAVSPKGGTYAVSGFAGTNGHGAVFKITSGKAAIVAQGGVFGGPLSIAFDPHGALFAGDQAVVGPGADGSLDRVKLSSGHPTYVSHGDNLFDPYGMTLAPNGKTAFLADVHTQSIVRVKVATGSQKVVATAPGSDFVSDVAYGRDGMLYAVNDGTGPPSVLKINPATGGIETLTASSKLKAPEGITVQP